MRVARVTASLGDTIVDLAHVAPGERYTIGSARDTQLAIAGIHAFPLVTGEARGFVVRGPVGLGTLAVDGRACTDAELVLAGDAAGGGITFALGLVTISIELVEHAPVAVPRPELERRTPAFVVASLIVHLLVWGTAITFAHPPRAKRPRPVTQVHPLVVHLAPLPAPPPPPPAPTPPPADHPPAAPAAARARIATSAPARRGTTETSDDHLPVDSDGVADPAAAMARLAAVTKDGYITEMLDQTGPLYVPSAVDVPFGANQRMDPKTRPGWARVEIVTGRYRTIGVDDPIPASQGLALCESRRCEVTGGLAKDDVQRVAATQGLALERCVNRGAVLLELDIAPDGHVTKIHGEGKTARCAATVIASLAFPAAADATHATFTIGYP